MLINISFGYMIILIMLLCIETVYFGKKIVNKNFRARDVKSARIFNVVVCSCSFFFFILLMKEGIFQYALLLSCMLSALIVLWCTHICRTQRKIVKRLLGM